MSGCGNGTTASVEEDGRLLLLDARLYHLPHPISPLRPLYKVHRENRGIKTQLTALPMMELLFLHLLPWSRPAFTLCWLASQSSGNLPAIMISGYMSLPAPSPSSLVLGFSRTPACSCNPQSHLILFFAFSCHLMPLAPKSAPLPGLKSSITGSLNISLFPGH